MSDSYGIKPADSAGASSIRPVFMRDFADMVADLIVGQFARERAFANAGSIGFADTDDFI
jgi:hypothetical protein